MWQVIAVRLAEAGFNVDDQVMDQATVVTRRNNREAPDKGGWSLLIANAPAADHLSPMVALGLRTGAVAWIGWPTDPAVELLREKWIDSADPDEQKRLAGEIQGIALADVLYSPLGHLGGRDRHSLPASRGGGCLPSLRSAGTGCAVLDSLAHG
jgi:peptide/nickel transport system substrate-binding protein